MVNKKKKVRHSVYLIFLPLLFLMVLLEIIRLPLGIEPFRPDFISVLLIFFVSFDPERINIGWAWIIGLMIDLLTGAPFGFNALIFAFEVYIIVAQFKGFINFLLWQQMLIIGIINLLGHVGVYWLGHLMAQGNASGSIGWTTLATVLLWPIMLVVFIVLCNAFNVVGAFSKKEANG